MQAKAIAGGKPVSFRLPPELAGDESANTCPVNTITANGQAIATKLPSTIEEFLVAQALLPRSVVVEHNGEAVAPSEFSRRQLNAGDRLEIVKIVAGG